MTHKTPLVGLQLPALLAVFIAAVPACGKKAGSGDPGAAPEMLRTEITKTSVTGSTALIEYSANIASAKFKCTTVVEGQPAPPAWSDCPDGSDTIQLASGVKTTFQVKAVDPATKVEELTPRSFDFASASAATGQGAVTTVILNKTDAANPYRKASLALHFGVLGSHLAPGDVRFECKRETEPAFHPCPSGATYELANLTDGQKVSLDVRGVVTASGIAAAPDHVEFAVSLGSLIVKNADQLLATKAGTVVLGWDPSQTRGGRVSCAVDQQAPTDCTASYSLNLSQLPAGSHVLQITAKAPDGAVLASTALSFCASRCSAAASATGAAAPPLVQSFQLGASYEYTVPADMHVTEYSTTKTYNGQVEFYRVTAQSDPTYLGNYSCGVTPFDNLITAAAPDGTKFDYCQTTPPTPDLTKGLTGFTVANNHLEVATNLKSVSSETHQYIDFNMFDADVEYMTGRSRFEELCLNRNGAIYVTPPVLNLVNANFWGHPVFGSLYICQVQFPNPTGAGLATRDSALWRNVWWVGAFFLTSDGLSLPQPECLTSDGAYEALDLLPGGPHDKYTYGAPHAPQPYAPNPSVCGTYSNPSLLEMTFVSKTPYPGPEQFAQDAMLDVMNLLHQIAPLIRP